MTSVLSVLLFSSLEAVHAAEQCLRKPVLVAALPYGQ